MIPLTSFLTVVIFIVQDPRPTYVNSIQDRLSGKVTLSLFQFVTHRHRMLLLGGFYRLDGSGIPRMLRDN
jgi:hypothetical protein